MDRFYAKLATVGAAISIAVLCMGMGDRDKANIQLSGPSFVKLEESQGNFLAVIFDEKTSHYVKELSFSGSTTVGGVRRENDASVRTIELSKIKEIKITQPHYNGKFFKGQDFMVADILASTDYLMENMLIPKNITICGIDRNTLVEKAWFLYEVSKITIESAVATGETPELVENIVSPTGETADLADLKIAPSTGKTHAQRVNHDVKRRRPVVDGWESDEAPLKKKVATPPLGTELQEEPTNKTIIDAFWTIIDAIIDFVRALAASLLGIFGFK